MPVIRIATRRSRLALWQAREAARQLQAAHAAVRCELVPMTTRGDRFLEAPLGQIGGKGLFVKELEQALLDGRADIAVHSMKDVTVDLPAGLQIPVILRRGNPCDALVLAGGPPPGARNGDLASLPAGARVGSSSLRRRSQIAALRPDLELKDARGNVDTRLAKLDAGEFDALILACAGLERLGLDARVSEVLDPERCIPAVAQGAMGIECRRGDRATESLIAPLDHGPSAVAVRAERSVNLSLAGGCHVPVAGHATVDGDRVRLRAMVGTLDGRRVLVEEASGRSDRAEALGLEVADRLRRAGAAEILAAVAASG